MARFWKRAAERQDGTYAGGQFGRYALQSAKALSVPSRWA
jgi:hypothetical protein